MVSRFSRSKFFDADMAEKVVLICLFVWLLVRMWVGFDRDSWLINALYIFDQLLVLIFCLVRRPTKKISLSVTDWVLGFGASFLPLMVIPASGTSLLPAPFAAVLMFIGIVLHLSAKLTLRRSFGVVAANRGIVISGPYKLVRHPMYAGYFLTQLSVLLAGPNWYNLIVILTAWVFQVFRLQAEERFYAGDPVYAELCKQTKYRILPCIY